MLLLIGRCQIVAFEGGKGDHARDTFVYGPFLYDRFFFYDENVKLLSSHAIDQFPVKYTHGGGGHHLLV